MLLFSLFKCFFFVFRNENVTEFFNIKLKPKRKMEKKNKFVFISLNSKRFTLSDFSMCMMKNLYILHTK